MACTTINPPRKRRIFFALAVTISVLLSSCGRTKTPAPEDALRPVEPQVITDDLPMHTLGAAVALEIGLFEKGKGPAELRFGETVFRRDEYLAALKQLAALIHTQPPDVVLKKLPELFDFYEVYGSPSWGDVLVTGYYEPRIRGSRTPTKTLSQPLYGRPADLVDGELYATREEIDSSGKLAGRGLELCYVDPIEGSVLQTQGSGVIELEDGSPLRLVFAGKNGQPYKPIGKFLQDVLPPERRSLQDIERYLRTLPPAELREVLNKNPSYVFFEPHPLGARTSIGVSATAGRTIAIDPHLFPKGGLGLLTFEHPAPPGGKVRQSTRLVLAQDTGSAIKGPARVDLFWGQGESAKYFAGRLKSKGKLYFLGPKKGSGPLFKNSGP